MGSDPLTTKKPVNLFNPPNHIRTHLDAARHSLVPSSLASLVPFPPPVRRRQHLFPPTGGEISSGIRQITSGSERIPPQEGVAASHCHPERISLQYRRKAAEIRRISARAPGKKGMRGYFGMLMLDVDLS